MVDRRRARIRAASLALSLVAVLLAWLLAAPPGASPDDGYHLSSIWCADGFKDGICVEDVGSGDPSRALVPQPVVALACFGYDGSVSAACQREALSSTFLQLVPAVTNLDGARPNLYYRTAHLLIGDGQDVGAAAARIRVANAAITAVLVLLTALVAERRLRVAFLVSWVLAAVPLGVFLITSINSSAWGIAGLTTFWANALTAIDHPERRNRVMGAILAAVGIVMGFGSRTEAVAHVLLIGAAIALLWLWRRRLESGPGAGRPDARRLLIGAGAVVIVAAGLVLAAPRSAGLDGLLESLRDGYGRIAAREVGDPFLAIAFEVPTLWAGALGNVWGLGVLDTPIPSLASFPLMGMFVGLVAVGLHAGSRARVAAVVLLLAGLFALPTFALLRSGLLVYEELQPRQFMVLLFALLGIALYRSREEPALTLGLAGRLTAVLALGLANSMALLVTIQRHTSGLLPGFLGEPRHVGFGREIEWWWATAPSPTTVWILGSLAYVALVALVVRGLAPGAASERVRG